MAYLIQEIFWYLAIAFVLGAVVAWLLCKQQFDKKLAALSASIPEE